MEIDLARSLVAVAEAGSFTAAAAHLFVSQSALSRRVQRLEAELGTALFVRGRHGVELTDAGRIALADCRSILGQYGAMRRSIDDHLGLRRGEILVGAGATATSTFLPSAIAEFRTAHPDIRFVVKEAGSGEIVDDILGGRIHVGIVTLPVSTPWVDVATLVDDDIVLVARDDDPLPPEARPHDLVGRSLVAFEAASAIRRIIDAKLGAAGIPIDISMELRSVPTMLQMVAATGDVAFVSSLAAHRYPGLRVVPIQGLVITRELGLVTRQGIPLEPAAFSFVELLRAGIG